MLMFVTPQRPLGFLILAMVALGAIGFVLANLRAGRAEIGSEVELAPNRKPYFDDENLESKRLNAALWVAAGMLAVIALTLPFYWMGEPARHLGAEEYLEGEIFVERGLGIYETGAQCVNCHGSAGSGGSATYVINNEAGEFLQQVTWSAPALDTVLWRFSEKEVFEILDYGRPGTPMPAWGVNGGGPLTTQQLQNAINYLWTVQLSMDEMREQVNGFVEEADPELAERMMAVQEKNAEVTDEKWERLDLADELRLGEILFYLNKSGGSYSCARCHVPGASFGQAWKSLDELGVGRIGPNLIGIEASLTPTQHFDLVMKGSEFGRQFGTVSKGSGGMPSFGLNPNFGNEDAPNGEVAQGMFSPEQVWAIVTYERSLSTERPDLRAGAAAAATPTASGDGAGESTTAAASAAGNEE